MIAEHRLYLTSDRRRVVAEGDLAAAFLLCAKGDQVADKYAAMMDAPKPSAPLPIDVEIAPPPKRKRK